MLLELLLLLSLLLLLLGLLELLLLELLLELLLLLLLWLLLSLLRLSLLRLFSVGSLFSECLCARAVDADTNAKRNTIRQERTSAVLGFFKRLAFMSCLRGRPGRNLLPGRKSTLTSFLTRGSERELW